MHPFVNTATMIARQAGALIVRAMDRRDKLKVQTKGLHDYCTQVDLQSEALIVSLIQQHYPDHGIIAEEGNQQDSTHKEDITWIVDPLDGTTNFIHGIPHLCVSIGILQNGHLEHGIVYDPFRDELFTATRGQGARLNQHRLRMEPVTLNTALLGTGFPYRELKPIQQYLAILEDLMQNSAGIRRFGAAALDLCYVAANRFDGFFEFNLKPWDIAAGALIISEAGGKVTDLEGELNFMDNGHILAAHPQLHAALLEKIQAHRP